MRTQTGTLALIDQVMAALAYGPGTTSELAVRVKSVYCCCHGCRGRQRACYPDDIYPILRDLAGRRAVEGVLDEGDEILWRRLLAPATVVNL